MSWYEVILQKDLVNVCPQIQFFIPHDFLEIWQLFSS